MQQRYYDPDLGRFYANDPVGYVSQNPIQNFNRYAYGNNNPYKFVDPDPDGEYAAPAVCFFGGCEAFFAAIGLGVTYAVVDASVTHISELTSSQSKPVNKKLTPDTYGTPPGGGGDNDDEDYNWTPHGYKHVAPKNKSWSKVRQSTRHGDARYKHGTNIEKLERSAWKNGKSVTNGKNWKVMQFDKTIGANSGRDVRWMRVELSGNTLHGHPITHAQYLKLLR